MTNEHRAHDLTLDFLKLDIHIELEKKPCDRKEIDMYSRYMEMYPKVLEKVNRDFPKK